MPGKFERNHPPERRTTDDEGSWHVDGGSETLRVIGQWLVSGDRLNPLDDVQVRSARALPIKETPVSTDAGKKQQTLRHLANPMMASEVMAGPMVRNQNEHSHQVERRPLTRGSVPALECRLSNDDDDRAARALRVPASNHRFVQTWPDTKNAMTPTTC